MNRDLSRFLHNSVRFLDNCWFCGKAVIGLNWRTLFGRLAWLTNCLGGALSSYGRNGRLAGLTDCLGEPSAVMGAIGQCMGQFRTGALTLGPIGSGVTPRRSPTRCVEAKDLYDPLEGNHDPAA
jgi:hypothetical protein